VNNRHDGCTARNQQLKRKKPLKTDMLRSIGKQSEKSVESVLHGEEKEGYGGKDLQKRKVLSLK